jgi:hypothetical protein
MSLLSIPSFTFDGFSDLSSFELIDASPTFIDRDRRWSKAGTFSRTGSESQVRRVVWKATCRFIVSHLININLIDIHLIDSQLIDRHLIDSHFINSCLIDLIKLFCSKFTPTF